MTAHNAPRVEIDPTSGCWNWVQATDTKGYGVKRDKGQLKRAHRWMYELTLGPIPSGMELDHLCRNRKCVNPAHLEPVTHIENARRGVKTKLSDPMRSQIAKDMDSLISDGMSQREASRHLAQGYFVSADYLRTVYREERKCLSTE